MRGFHGTALAHPYYGGERGLVVGRRICNPEVPGSNTPPCHWMDLSSVAPNLTPPRLVNSQLVSLPPVGILNLLCLSRIIFVCYAHLNIFTWNLRDINVYYYYYYYYYARFSRHSCAQMSACTYTTKKNFSQAKLDSEINARFLLNKHGNLYLIIVHIISSLI